MHASRDEVNQNTDDATHWPIATMIRVTRWFLVLISIAAICIEVWGRAIAYESQWEQSRRAVENITQAAVEHADATIDAVTWALDGVVERVEAEGAAGNSGGRLQRFLASRVEKERSPLQGIFVFDKEGNWAFTSMGHPRSHANNRDRGYFAYHRTNPDRGVLVGEPIVSRSTNEWVVPVSRRINDEHGKFAGVALATIPVNVFSRYYEPFSVGKHGAILLAKNNGTVVTRLPKGPQVIGSNVSRTPLFVHMGTRIDTRGTVMMLTHYDQTERLHSYRRSAHYPLVVAVALSKEEIFADWWRVTLQECAAIGAMLGSLYIGGFWLIVQLRARERLEQRLKEAQANLEERNLALDRLARTDGLTGVYNRRCFDERLTFEIARCARDRTSLALILIDVDHFKPYNDSYGHLQGDSCLRTIAAVIKAQVSRPADIVARYGGEEFAVLLPNTDDKGACAIAHAIRTAVHAKGLAHVASDLQVVTISAGVASIVPRHDLEPRELIEAADAGLYSAKAAGRNGVHGWPGEA